MIPTPLESHPLLRHPAAIALRRMMAAAVAITREPGMIAAAYSLPGDSSAAVMPAGAVIEVKLSVPVGTYLIGTSGSSSQAAGCEAQVIDLRHNAPAWSSPVRFEQITNQAAGPQGASFPLVLFDQPRLVIEPGVILIRLKNLATAANTVELLLFCAEPAR